MRAVYLWMIGSMAIGCRAEITARTQPQRGVPVIKHKKKAEISNQQGVA